MADAEIYRLGAILLLALVAASLTYFTLVQRSLESCMMGICLFNGWLLWSSSARKVTSLDFPPEASSISFEIGLLILVMLLLFWMLHVTRDQDGVSFVTDSNILSCIVTSSILYLVPFIFSYLANWNDPPLDIARYVALFLVWGWMLAALRLMNGYEVVVRSIDEKIETAAA